jgi:hypothetical protein
LGSLVLAPIFSGLGISWIITTLSEEANSERIEESIVLLFPSLVGVRVASVCSGVNLSEGQWMEDGLERLNLADFFFFDDVRVASLSLWCQSL